MAPSTLRTHATGSLRSDDVRHETEAGIEYLVVNGVPARAPHVYEYDHGSELLPPEELEGLTDEAPIVLDHPVANGQFVGVSSPGASPDVVGEFRNAAVVDDTDGAHVVGEYWLDTSKRDLYPGYADALETLENGGEVETSPGYNPEIDPTSGRTQSGERYAAVQKSPSLDHVGLIVNGHARCSLSEGCGIGRANCTSDRPCETDTMQSNPPQTTAQPDDQAHAILDNQLRANGVTADLSPLSFTDKKKLVAAQGVELHSTTARKAGFTHDEVPGMRINAGGFVDLSRADVKDRDEGSRQNAAGCECSGGDQANATTSFGHSYDEYRQKKAEHGESYYARQRSERKRTRANEADQRKQRQNARLTERSQKDLDVPSAGHDSYQERSDGDQTGDSSIPTGGYANRGTEQTAPSGSRSNAQTSRSDTEKPAYLDEYREY
ncbi:DUF2213 domain-containing protein [Natronorubrum sp. FCH18a]|uniref:DUF2213 domain-containing protein n=1 Tax=Natronorubrum sp. FCH18a TaxID=3447018 RepID=UPI003F510D38